MFSPFLFFPDLNLLDWSSRNILAVALHNSVYLWDATQGDITLLMKLEREEDYICSLSWTKEGSYLAIGTSDCKVQVSVLMRPYLFLIHKTHGKLVLFLMCVLCFLLSCGMLTTRSVYAAWPAIQPELVASAGMTMFFPGTVFSLDTKDKLKFPVFVWTRM